MRNRLRPRFPTLPGARLFGGLTILALLATAASAADQLTPPPNPFDTPPPGTAVSGGAGAKDMQACLGRKVLAALTCKTEGDFNYLQQVDGVYVYSGFFGSKDSLFYCDMNAQGSVVVSAQVWGPKRFTAQVSEDAATRCLKASGGRSLCGGKVAVRCCADGK